MGKIINLIKFMIIFQIAFQYIKRQHFYIKVNLVSLFEIRHFQKMYPKILFKENEHQKHLQVQEEEMTRFKNTGPLSGIQFLTPTWMLSAILPWRSRGPSSPSWPPHTPGKNALHRHASRQSAHAQKIEINQSFFKKST